MGMKALDEAVARIALEVHPDRIHAVCSVLRVSKDTKISPAVVKVLLAPLSRPGSSRA